MLARCYPNDNWRMKGRVRRTAFLILILRPSNVLVRESESKRGIQFSGAERVSAKMAWNHCCLIRYRCTQLALLAAACTTFTLYQPTPPADPLPAQLAQCHSAKQTYRRMPSHPASLDFALPTPLHYLSSSNHHRPPLSSPPSLSIFFTVHIVACIVQTISNLCGLLRLQRLVQVVFLLVLS